jgi:peptide deformylase
MYEYDGVWLASPQIWKNIRMIATTTRKTGKRWQELASDEVMINPIITEASSEMATSEEACLSLPNMIWDVKRHKNITVEYKNTEWFKKKKKLKNYNAFIIQHEIDHLNWILFIDRVIPDKNEGKERFGEKFGEKL